MPQIVKVTADGGIGGGGHGSAHVVGILDTVVHHGADGGGVEERPLLPLAQQDTSGSRDGPLGRGGPLAAVAQWKPVLPLC